MNALLDHVWGISPAADRVWAQVTGLSPRLAGGRILVPLQAFIDDSYDAGGTFVLGGYISSAENWAKFSKEWEELLPWATVDSRGRRRFKMSEMAISAEGMERVGVFYRVIEKYDLVAVSCRIDTQALRRTISRFSIQGSNINWGQWKTPFSYAFVSLMDFFHREKEQFQSAIPLTDKVDFIFDKQSEKAAIDAAWEQFVGNRVSIADRFGANPRFEDDTEFLPLQAADLWAWWVRTWHNAGHPDIPLDFPGWKRSRKVRWIQIVVDEAAMVDTIRRVLASQANPGTVIIEMNPSSLKPS